MGLGCSRGEEGRWAGFCSPLNASHKEFDRAKDGNGCRAEAGKVAEYKRLHADVWPSVLAQIASSNIRNYSIFLKEPENLLFAYWECHGTNFAADAARMAGDPETRRWWDRFLAEGVDGLLRDATRPPGKKPIPKDRVRAVIALAMPPPPEHARHWTVRAPARRLGMVISTVHGILKDHGLRPHQVKTFQVSRDPRFEIKVRDVVGLHVHPPDHAVVLSVDRKTQIRRWGGRRGRFR